MASLQKVKVKGRSYWRIVQSRRVDGKPRAIPVMHLGTADALLERLRRAPAEGLRIRSYQHGDVAALKAVADDLGIVSLIDGHARKCARSISVGTTLLLAAMHRVSATQGRRSWSSWAKSVSLPRLFPEVSPGVLTPRFFWDQMDFLPSHMLREVEEDLTRAIVSRLDLRLDTLLYDRSRLFSYLEPTRLTPQRGRRGHSHRPSHERGRADDYRLRFMSHSLLLSREGRIPIFSQVYEAEADAPAVGATPDGLERVRRRLASLSLPLREVTAIFGENEDAWHDHALSPPSRISGYVAPFRPAGTRPERSAAAATLARLGGGGRGDSPVLRLNGEWERLRGEGSRGHEDGRGHGGGKSRHDRQRLLSWIHEQARSHLGRDDAPGEDILITNRHGWSDREVMDAWRSRDDVAEAFWRAPDETGSGVTLQPDYHWTAHKVQVHAFLCWIGFLLERLLEYEARPRLHRQVRAADLLDSLGHVRVALVAWKPSVRSRSFLCDWRLEEGDETDLDLFHSLVPRHEPFAPSAEGEGGTSPARGRGPRRGGAASPRRAARTRSAPETEDAITKRGGEDRGRRRRDPSRRATPERGRKSGERRASRHGPPHRDPGGSSRSDRSHADSHAAIPEDPPEDPSQR